MNNQNQSLISQNQSLENQNQNNKENQIVQSQIKESSNQIESLRRSVRVNRVLIIRNCIRRALFENWFENWLLSHVPKLMFHPKWFNSERDVKVGDVILFLKNEGNLNNTYQYGMIKDVEFSKDDKIRRVTIKYRNTNENTNRETRRAVRNIVMIHPVDETCIAQELGEMAMKAAMVYCVSSIC